MSNTDFQLTEKEQEKLSEFKLYVAEKHTSVRKQLWDDWFLLRFCRNKKDLKTVKKNFDKYVEFYIEYGLDNIIDFCKEKTEDYKFHLKNSSYHCVISKENEEITFVMSKFTSDKELTKLTMKSFIQNYLKKHEELNRVKFPILSKKAGKRIDKHHIVYDLEDVPLGDFFDGKVQKYTNE